MADPTVLSLLQALHQQVTALSGQVTALAAQVTALSAQNTAGTTGVRQLVSDTQAAVLHIQDTLGHPDA